MTDGTDYTFAPVTAAEKAAGVRDLSEHPLVKLMACSIANQQRAGFGTLLDMRQIPCPRCKVPGFNSGWGTIEFLCGASTTGDEWMDECTAKEAAELTPVGVDGKPKSD